MKWLELAFAAVLLALVVSGCSSVADDWRDARQTNTQEAYGQFLKQHAGSPFADSASIAIRELMWDQIELGGTVEQLTKYLELYPDSDHIERAGQILDSLRWQQAVGQHTIQGFDTYLDEQPEGRYVGQAAAAVDTLHWRQAAQANEEAAYKEYLEQYPAGAFTQAATSSILWLPFVSRSKGTYCFAVDTTIGQLSQSCLLTIQIGAGAAPAHFIGVCNAGGSKYVFDEQFSCVWADNGITLVNQKNSSRHFLSFESPALVGKHPILDLGDVALNFTIRKCRS